MATSPLVLALLLAFATASAAALTAECGNGNACDVAHTCTSNAPNAGRAFGCAIHANATICKDRRFACPASSECGVCPKKLVPLCTDRSTGAVVAATKSITALSVRSDYSLSGGVCSVISEYVPSFCSCVDGKNYASTLKCSVNLLDELEIGLVGQLSPCALPATVSLDITGPDGFDFRIATLRTGTKKTIPVPGLSVAIPVVGSAGVVVDLQLDGNLNDLQVEIGFDACITTRIGQECGSALTSLLPLWILNQTLSFASVCK